jgi:hypothetical protein
MPKLTHQLLTLKSVFQKLSFWICGQLSTAVHRSVHSSLDQLLKTFGGLFAKKSIQVLILLDTIDAGVKQFDKPDDNCNL